MGRLGLSTRDWIWIATMAAGWVANYAAVTSTMAARLDSMERTVERVEARLWELRGGRTHLGTAPHVCPPDATAVHLTDRRDP